MMGANQRPDEYDLAAFAVFAQAFEERSFVAGTVHPPEEVEPGVMALGWWAPSDLVAAWHEALYEHQIIDPDSDYLSVAWSRRMEKFAANPALLEACDLPTVRTALTNISRGDRFCDGYMAGMFDNGVAQAATRRLVESSKPD